MVLPQPILSNRMLLLIVCSSLPARATAEAISNSIANKYDVIFRRWEMGNGKWDVFPPLAANAMTQRFVSTAVDFFSTVPVLQVLEIMRKSVQKCARTYKLYVCISVPPCTHRAYLLYKMYYKFYDSVHFCTVGYV